MAIAIGLGAWELAALAAAGLTALFMSTPAGQQATRNAVNQIAESLDRSDARAEAPPTTCKNCREKTNCPPCPPPPPPRIDRVPPSRPHFPCLGDHMHVFKMNQNPRTCECFVGKEEVVCL
jgi:type IV secretory pathway VirB10-like protein